MKWEASTRDSKRPDHSSTASASRIRHSSALRRKIPLRVTTRALRTVSRAGGLDAYLLRTNDAKLAPEGLRLKRQVKKALAGKPQAAASAAS